MKDQEINETVVVFQPGYISRFLGENGPVEFLERIVAQHAELLLGQIRIFPYAIQQNQETGYKRAGLIYTIGEPDNPLTRAEREGWEWAVREGVRCVGGVLDSTGQI